MKRCGQKPKKKIKHFPLPKLNNFLLLLLQGGNGNMNSSEFVRQELRAVVNSRSQQSTQSPLGNSGGMGQGPMVGNNNQQMNMAQQQQQMPGTPILNTPPDPTLGFNFEMAQTGEFDDFYFLEK